MKISIVRHELYRPHRGTSWILPAIVALATIAHDGHAQSQAATGTASRHVVSLKDSPGYQPLVDPESTSVVIGRRLNAPRVDKLFAGGAPTLDALGRAVCRALHRSDSQALLDLCITDDEFRDILWREFPQSRPVTGLAWEDGWKILYARLHAGCMHAMRDQGGHVYQLLRVEKGSSMRYRNFTLHSGLVLVVRDDEGQVQRWPWLRAVAERKGTFKIYSTED